MLILTLLTWLCLLLTVVHRTLSQLIPSDFESSQPVQFSSLTDWVAGETGGKIQQRSFPSVFRGRLVVFQ